MVGISLLSQAVTQPSRVGHDQPEVPPPPLPSVLMIEADTRSYTFAHTKGATGNVTLRTEGDDAQFAYAQGASGEGFWAEGLVDRAVSLPPPQGR